MNIPEQDISNKIVSSSDLKRIRDTIVKDNKSLVLVNGTFDWAHIGHISLLQYACRLGDILIVLCNTDDSIRELKGPSRPLISLDKRLWTLASLSCTDYVSGFNEKRVTRYLYDLKPDIWVKASDYTMDSIDREEMVAANEIGINIKIMPKIYDYSTSSLFKKMNKGD